MHTIQGRYMGEGKCGEVRGGIGVREGKEGERGNEERERNLEEAQKIYGGHSTCRIGVGTTCM